MGIFTKKSDSLISDLFGVGAHFGYSKSRRHPSARDLIFGSKNKIELIDLEATAEHLEKVREYVEELAKAGKTILFVSGKAEARKVIKEVADRLEMPFVAGRWVGGALTNFDNIRGRVEKLISLRTDREKGEFKKHTKKERLMIDREIERLEKMYDGLVRMVRKPDVMFVVDTNAERIAVKEAQRLNIPVISISGTDCDMTMVEYPIPANDKSTDTIRYIVNVIANTFEKHFAQPTAVAEKK